MSDGGPANQKKQFDQIAADEARALLQSGVPTRAKILIWTEKQKHSITTRISRVFESGPAQYIAIPKQTLDDVRFEESLKREHIEECFCTLYLPTDTVFFKAEIKRSDPAAMNFRVVDPVYKAQRRMSMRLPLPDAEAVWVTFKFTPQDEDTANGYLLNVSDGGIAMKVTEDDLYKKLPVGTKLHQMNFQVAGTTIYVDGEVRHVMEVASAKLKRYYKIGIQFTRIEAKDKDRVSKFVLEESSKFFGRI